MGSERGGERAATMCSLVETAKLNGINPEAYLRHVVSVIADYPVSSVADLLPWNISSEQLAPRCQDGIGRALARVGGICGTDIESGILQFKTTCKYMNITAKTVEPEIQREAAANQERNAKSEADQYRKEQKARLAAFVIGAKDLSGDLITKIYSRGDEYVIYEVAGLSEEEAFRTLIDTAIEEDPEGILGRFEDIKLEIVTFRSMIFKGIHDKSVKHQAAAAISTALRGDTAKAKEIFQSISERVCREYTSFQRGRILYSVGALSLTVLALITAVLAFVFVDASNTEKLNQLKPFAYAGAFASLGGFLSVCINIRGMHFERDLGAGHFLIYGAQRLLISIMCGVLAYTIIKSGVALSFVLASPSPTLAVLVICAVAGFSETFIPNSLAGMEKKE